MKIKIAILAAALALSACTEQKAEFEFGSLSIKADKSEYGTTVTGKIPLRLKTSSLNDTPMLVLVSLQKTNSIETSEEHQYVIVIDGVGAVETYQYVSANDEPAKYSNWQVVGYVPMSKPAKAP